MAKTVPLFAARRFTYDTRRLLPGDEFMCDRRFVKLLTKSGKATEKRAPVDLAPPPADVAKKIAAAAPANPAPLAQPPTPPAADAGEDLAALRAAYKEKLGKAPFYGWDAATLREKIDAAQVS